MNNITRQGGFSLIEIVIVVAIIAILAAIAIPLYFNYVVRAQSTSALSLAEGFKPAAATYYNLHGNWAGVRSNADIGMPPPKSFANNYLKSIHVVASGKNKNLFQIIAIYCQSGNNPDCVINKALQGTYLMLEGWVRGETGESGSIVWYCVVNDKHYYRYVPPKCRHTSVY